MASGAEGGGSTVDIISVANNVAEQASNNGSNADVQDSPQYKPTHAVKPVPVPAPFSRSGSRPAGSVIAAQTADDQGHYHEPVAYWFCSVLGDSVPERRKSKWQIVGSPDRPDLQDTSDPTVRATKLSGRIATERRDAELLPGQSGIAAGPTVNTSGRQRSVRPRSGRAVPAGIPAAIPAETREPPSVASSVIFRQCFRLVRVSRAPRYGSLLLRLP